MINLRKNTSRHGQLTAVSMMKDEAPFLLEWFAHHMAIGFTDILVYTNDCSDGTDDMLIRIEELGLGYHRRNDIPEGRRPQPSALKYAQADPIVQASDWLLVFDADEFLCIKYGDGSLDAMIDAAGDANGIVITWRIFGSNGVERWSREPVTEQYVSAAPAAWNKGWGVKTLFKFDPDYWKLGIHRPSIKAKHLQTDYPDTIHWLNGSGLPMEDYFKFRGWRSIRRTVGYDWAQMNHYAVKSIDSYAVRKFRGNVNLKKDKYNADYWALQDRNEVRETSVLRHSEKRAEIMAELLKDPILNKLHFAALERVEARLNEFRATDDFETLKAGLLEASKVPIEQVEAKPPQARDPAKIAALMSSVEKETADRPKKVRRSNYSAEAGAQMDISSSYVVGKIDRSTDIAFESVANHDILLPADPRVFSTAALEDLNKGKFQRRAARHITRLTDSKNRMLELGAGVCFLSILACQNNPELVVLAHEEHKVLAKVGAEIAAANAMGDTARLKIVDGPLFFPSDGDDQASGLVAYMNDFNPSIVSVGDVRVTVQLLISAMTKTVRRLILPETPQITSQAQQAADLTMLKELGFIPVEGFEKSGSVVLDRAKV